MIVNCHECGHKISSRANLCPNCGIENAGWDSSVSSDYRRKYINLDESPNYSNIEALFNPVKDIGKEEEKEPTKEEREQIKERIERNKRDEEERKKRIEEKRDG